MVIKVVIRQACRKHLFTVLLIEGTRCQNHKCRLTLHRVPTVYSCYHSSHNVCIYVCSDLGISSTHGFADDYAFMICGLLDLYEASQNVTWLEWAWNLQEKMILLFWDKIKGGFFSSTGEDSSILLRLKEGI